MNTDEGSIEERDPIKRIASDSLAAYPSDPAASGIHAGFRSAWRLSCLDWLPFLLAAKQSFEELRYQAGAW